MTYLSVTSWITAALTGVYAFTWGLLPLGSPGWWPWVWIFIRRKRGILMLAFLVFLVMFLWTFTAISMLKVGAVLALGGFGLKR